MHKVLISLKNLDGCTYDVQLRWDIPAISKNCEGWKQAAFSALWIFDLII